MSSVFEGAASFWWQWTAAMSVQLFLVVLVIAGLDLCYSMLFQATGVLEKAA